MVLLDLVSAESSKVLWGFSCNRPGAFSISVPADLGLVSLVVWLDTTGDGPSEEDARGEVVGLSIASEDLGGLAVPVSTPP